MIVHRSNNVARLKLHDLRCFDAVARLGSFQAAADSLHRSHPSVFAAIARLEDQLGLTLLDRSGYRVGLTKAGGLFHERATTSLRDIESLEAFARQLAIGEETSLRIVLGDLCPRPTILGLLSNFFADQPRTRLHLDYESVTGPYERLTGGSADMIFHRVGSNSHHFEQINICEVELVPVAAPGFLPIGLDHVTSLQELQSVTQCVIRDSAHMASGEDHFLIEGASRCFVPDHAMKKELIVHGLAWGHLPDFMAIEELRNGTLLSLKGRLFPGRREALAAMRRADRTHGPVADRLWNALRKKFSPE